jgi:hypothetical protein
MFVQIKSYITHLETFLIQLHDSEWFTNITVVPDFRKNYCRNQWSGNLSSDEEHSQYRQFEFFARSLRPLRTLRLSFYRKERQVPQR